MVDEAAEEDPQQKIARLEKENARLKKELDEARKALAAKSCHTDQIFWVHITNGRYAVRRFKVSPEEKRSEFEQELLEYLWTYHSVGKQEELVFRRGDFEKEGEDDILIEPDQEGSAILHRTIFGDRVTRERCGIRKRKCTGIWEEIDDTANPVLVLIDDDTPEERKRKRKDYELQSSVHKIKHRYRDIDDQDSDDDDKGSDGSDDD